MKKRIYADNAATTKLSAAAAKAMQIYSSEEYANPSSLHSLGRNSKKILTEARERIAAIIDAEPSEIYFTSGGTESDNLAVKGSAFCYPLKKKRIITSSIEHHAILRSTEFLAVMGYDIFYLHVDEFGLVNALDLEKAINDDTVLISVMLANNEIGTIEPIFELARIAHKHNIPFHTDAVQAVGHIPISVKELGVDMLSASAHKFNGPRGVGFLYVRKGTNLTPLMNGGGQEAGLRAGTENLPAIMGMTLALEESYNKISQNKDYLSKLEEIILQGLSENNIDYRINGSKEKLPGLISLSFKDGDGEKILNRLDLANICISTGSACNSRETEISHVLKAIHLEEQYAKGTIRISLGIDNTEDETGEILKAIVKDAKRFW